MATKRRRNRSRNRTRRLAKAEHPVVLDPAVEMAFDALDELYALRRKSHEKNGQLAPSHEQVLESYFANFQSRGASSRTLESCRLYLKYLTEKSFPNLVFFSVA